MKHAQYSSASTALIFVLAAFSAHAEGPVFDPAATLTIVCDAPVRRTDGTALAVGEIAEFRFFRSTDGASWTAADNTSECRTVVTGLPEGQYYYTATAVDTEGRESAQAAPIPFVLRRIQPPEPPTNLSIQAS